jgi:tRNA threonylcarbamoyladenosine biosynthesis protein TsaB
MPVISPSPSLLAIETATELCSVAVHHAGHTWQETLQAGQQHSTMLLPMVKRVMEQAGATLSQLDAIAFGAGPGSFTGLRIACGVAQGLAFAHDLPVVAVPSLEALALAAQASESRNVLCAIDARMGEVYVAQYRIGIGASTDNSSTDAHTECLQKAQVLKPEALMAQFDAQTFDCLLGNAWERFPELVTWAQKHTQAHTQAHAQEIRADCQPNAGQVLRIATREFIAGNAVAAEMVSPLYVRNRIALTTIERNTGARL